MVEIGKGRAAVPFVAAGWGPNAKQVIDPIPFQGTNDILHCLTVRLISDARKESDARPVCFSGYSFVQLNSDFRAEPIHRSTLDSVLCGHGCGMYIHDTPQTNIIIEQ
jgi:hypothetical protein